MSTIRRAFLMVVAALAVAVAMSSMGGARHAAAHPLGNFTINRLARLVLNTGEAQVRYVIDMAEIPAFQEIRRIDKDGDGAVSEAEGAAYVQTLAPEIGRQLELTAGGDRIALSLSGGIVSTPEGQGGLSTLRVVLDYTGVLPAGWQEGVGASLRDNNFKDRVGWREIVVQAGPGVALTQSSAASLDETAELTLYPESKLKSPPDVRAARFRFEAGDASTVVVPASVANDAGKVRSPGKMLDGFAGLVDEGNLTPAFIALSMLAAAAWGAAHALGPGHGKTIVAAYLVGSRGTAKHAAILGLTVTATHTITVFGLGLITLSASSLLDTQDLYLWLSVGSGVMVVAMGLGLFFSRLRSVLASRQSANREIGHGHAHEHGSHGHDHGAQAHSHDDYDHASSHSHDHGHAQEHGSSHDHSHGGHGHSHMPTQPGLKGLIALGVSGGLLPCPTALVVMLGAIALDRTAYGLALVLAFSIGLAGVLTGIGLLLVFARRLLEGTSDRFRFLNPALTRRAIQALPVLSSLGIVAAGLLITSNALSAV